ncbi:hypothetical protein PV328_009589 [Microctonus aethiopoides]|uniref:Protein stoned-A n=1 Tax=Microctonus aethiopoides TaxID=144406 RepID=A0AA39EZI9_9HYME|nr:hypothetical protein PV328_009589 [Microctonus aethiopoides]
MHKLMHKGLKKKKKSKKGKKEAEEEFDPEELERYRRERAEALVKASSEVADSSSGSATETAGSDEWKKFQALTAGVDSILKKTQGDLDRIKSTSFFQRKAPVVEEKKPEEDPEVTKNKSKRFIGFDKDGNPIEQESVNEGTEVGEKKLSVNESGFVEIPDDEDDEDDSADEDIFDTTYVDVLQNIDVQLAYIPDSPVEDQSGDDPFDTTNADKVLKTVDKHGKKVVSLGNAVEVLSGRIDHVSTCKISRPIRGKIPDLLLDDFNTDETVCETISTQPCEVEKTLLDDDDNTELQDIPIDLTNLPPIIKPETYINTHTELSSADLGVPIDISEFEVIKEKKILEEIPDLDDEFDLDGPIDESIQLVDADDPFAEKESVDVNVNTEIIEASFEAATFVNEEDPFDTTFAENLVPGKAELKFIEKELEELELKKKELPESEVSISLTDPSGLHRDYETGLLTAGRNQFSDNNQDLLGGSSTDLTQLSDQPIVPAEEITYVDPFDTSGIQESVPGKTELKFLEKELLSNDNQQNNSLDDDDFDPRKEETSIKSSPQRPSAPPTVDTSIDNSSFASNNSVIENENDTAVYNDKKRKPSRPEALNIGAAKTVAFELPTPSQRPDLLITSDEEKSIASKPLTPYYSQKSLEETLPHQEVDATEIDPFDTSFVSKVTPGKTELKLIESELLKQETKLTHSISEHEINARFEAQSTAGRRQSDFGASSVRPKSLKFTDIDKTLIEDTENIHKSGGEAKEVVRRAKFQSKRQESLLDADVVVDAKTLTPHIESKVLEEELEEEISYVDPFDTSIASNILPGKAELKQLESELSQIPVNIQPNKITNSIDLTKVSNIKVSLSLEDEDDFDPRAGEIKESPDFLSLCGDNSDDKILTPQHSNSYAPTDSVDPFDTSFAIIGPGKTELKLLESELMDQ